MPLLSDYARKKKIEYFLRPIPKDSRILEVGCGSRWVGEYLTRHGWSNYVGLDLAPPADIVGDIRQWRKLGLAADSFDVILAFELVEHVDCFRECYELLKVGGRLMITSPVPRMDWIMKILEAVGLNQKRTSPHDHLIAFQDVPYFERHQIKIVSRLAQWGTFMKAPNQHEHRDVGFAEPTRRVA